MLTQRPATMSDVADLARVSLKTVSRVVNGEPNVSPEMKSRILAAIDSLGFQPNRAARSLVTRRSGIIGIVAYGSPLYGPSSSLVGLVAAVKQHRLLPSIITTDANNAAEAVGAVRRLIAQGADGVVVAEPVAAFEVAENDFGGVPVVSVGGIAARGPVPIDRDLEHGVTMAVDHLLELGHDTVHHLAGAPDWNATSLRIAAWQATLERAGRRVPTAIFGDWTPTSGYESGRVLLEQEPTAVFVANDQMAFGFMKLCQDLGVDIPTDLSVVGFDDVPEATFHPTPLTTVRVDIAQNMSIAVDVLLRRIKGQPGYDREAVSPNAELIVRESTTAPISKVHKPLASQPGWDMRHRELEENL